MSVIFAEAHERSLSIGSDYVPQYTRAWFAETNDAGYGPGYVTDQLYTQLGIAVNKIYQTTGTQPESNHWSLITNIKTTELDDSGRRWKLTATYDKWNPLEFADGGNPLNTPTRMAVEGQVFQVPANYDAAGNPLINTAGFPFDPTIMIDRQRCTIRVSRNEQYFPTYAFANVDTINADYFLADPFSGFTGYPPGTVKVCPPRVEDDHHPIVGRYFKVEYLFDFNPQGWSTTVLNQGYVQYASSKWSRCKDGFGQDSAEPMPLASSGAQLTPPVSISNLVYLTFVMHNSISFTSTFNFILV